MKTLNNKTGNLKFQALALAALLPLAAQASDRMVHRGVRNDLSGHVEVTKQIPGGVITVGAEIGKPRPQVVVVEQRRPEVIVVEQRRPEVVVIEQRRPEVIVIEKDRGHRHNGHGNKHVTVVREHGRKIVIVKERGGRHDHGYRHDSRDDRHDRHGNHGYDHGNTQVYRDGNQVSVQKNGPHGTYQYYKDGNQVSERRTGPNGTYQYYEDANQMSIQDNRDGHQRNVYVRK
jgi:hypothetical protein